MAKLKRDKARDQKVYIDDGAKIGSLPVDEKIHLDDGPTIGKQPAPKKKPK